MNVIFMGTPEFAVPCLEQLIADGHTVSLVVTQGDKPKGRGQKLTPPPVKAAALEHHIPVLQPVSLKNSETQATLASYAPDLIVVVAYGKILPKAVLELPRFGCINVHASLLPRYRGAAPIQWAVLNGEAVSGVTTMFMNEGLDTGDMLLKAECPIDDDMTAGDLHDRLSELGAALLSQTLVKVEEGTLERIPQIDDDTCYAPMLTKDLREIDFTMPASQVHNRVRGLNPWPSATVWFEGKRLKLQRTAVGEACDAEPGTVVSTRPVAIACGERTSLVLAQVQYEGGKSLSAEDFFRGHPLTVGQRFGYVTLP
ncbi:MAG: methionyl-tRNA formyltransferase [Clostridia bacterium]|nr:methionyl-tRNA formyltransferase [Clostridia bacterium]